MEKWTTVEFWLALLEQLRLAGPALPIALAFLEALIPALPLVAIVTLNVGLHGSVLGLLYTWIGSVAGCLCIYTLAHRFLYPRLEKSKKLAFLHKYSHWVSGQSIGTLFLLYCVPFTPSSFVNLSFALSDFSPRAYVGTLLASKLIMLSALSLFGSMLTAVPENPIMLAFAVALLGGLCWLSNWLSRRFGLRKAAQKDPPAPTPDDKQ